MRAISTAYDQLLKARGGTMRRLRVSVKDSGGTFRDLTTYLGSNFLLAGSWGESVDDNGFEADFEVLRNQHKVNLSPYMTTSPANLGFAYPGVFAPLIDVGREILVEWAVAPSGTPASALTWVIGMRGHIDSHDPTDGRVRFTARGRFGQVLDAFIENERVYAHADAGRPRRDEGLRPYVEGETYAVNELVLPGEAKRNGHFYKVTAITTGIARRRGHLPTGGGAVVIGGVTLTDVGVTTVATGTALETVLQQIAQRQHVGADRRSTPRVARLADQVVPAAAHRHLVCDARARRSDRLGPARRVERGPRRPPLRAARSEPREGGARSHVRLGRSLHADAPREAPRRHPERDQGLVLRQRRPRRRREPEEEVARRHQPHLHREVRAALHGSGRGGDVDDRHDGRGGRVRDAMLSDLSEPNAEQELELSFFPFVELCDLYRFSSDGKHYDVNVDLAVIGYRHRATCGGKKPSVRTTITCRGKPATGYERWLKLDAGRNTHTHQTNPHSKHFANVTVGVGGPGSAKALAQETFQKHALPQGMEFHVSKIASFTPSTATLRQNVLGNKFEFTDGDPGENYYGATVPWFFNAQRKAYGAKSEEFTMVPGYLRPKHFQTEEFRGEMPLNGSFEAYSREEGLAVPPDQWEMQTGTWATDAGVGPAKGGVDARDGARYLRFINTNLATAVRSKWFPVPGGHVFELIAWIYRSGGANSFDLQLEWVTATKTAISTSTLTTNVTTLTDSAWNFMRTVFTAPATAAFARYIVKKSSAHTDAFHVDGVQIEDVGEDWHSIGAAGEPTFQNSWVNFGGNYAAAAFRKDAFGWVHLKGVVKTGTIGATIFVLPAGYLRAEYVYKAVESNNLFGIIEIQGNTGNVVCQVGNNAHVSLDCISFLAD
jgi:hypothetical protein